MRHRAFAPLIVAFLVCAPAPAIAQRITAARVGVAEVEPALDGARLAQPLGVTVAESPAPSRWPYVIGGALLGGIATGAWLAYQLSKDDDPMMTFAVPVVGIGAAVGALTGLLVSQVVRTPPSPSSGP